MFDGIVGCSGAGQGRGQGGLFAASAYLFPANRQPKTDDGCNRLVRPEALRGVIQEDVSEIETIVGKFVRLQTRTTGII